MKRRLVRLVGAPGSGRTTFLAMLYAYLIQNAEEDAGREPEFRLFADPESVRKGGDLYRRVASPAGRGIVEPLPWSAITLQVAHEGKRSRGLFRRKDSEGGEAGRVELTLQVADATEPFASPAPLPDQRTTNVVVRAILPPGARLFPRPPVGSPPGPRSPATESASPPTTGGLPSGPGLPHVPAFPGASAVVRHALLLTQWDVALRFAPDLKLPLYPPSLEDTAARHRLADAILESQRGPSGVGTPLPAGFSVHFSGLGSGFDVTTPLLAHHVNFPSYMPEELRSFLLEVVRE